MANVDFDDLLESATHNDNRYCCLVADESMVLMEYHLKMNPLNDPDN